MKTNSKALLGLFCAFVARIVLRMLCCHRCRVFILPICLLLFSSAALTASGVWTALHNRAPSGVELMLLLPDGTVMAEESPGGSNFSSNWFRLTPDSHGSYISGTWSSLASMNYTRYDFASIVLTNGQLFVAGGEYGTGTATAEYYDPSSNLWTTINIPTSLLNPAVMSPEAGTNEGFYDAIAKILPNGRVLVAPSCANAIGGTLVYDPVLHSFANGPLTYYKGYPDQSEASWVKLPDDSILTVDPSSTKSQRYIPSLNTWIKDADLPLNLSTNGEIGPAVLLQNGKAFFLGATGHTALYTPSGNTNLGTWVAGPDIPGGLTAADDPAAVLFNGNVLCCVGPLPVYSAPSSFVEYDPVANSFTQVSGPTNNTYYAAPYYTKMLALPDGSVLLATGGSRTIYDYQPAGTALSSAKPTITGISYDAVAQNYLMTGKLLNGINEGAVYGDDAQMDSNYPLVRLSDSTGKVYYARTFNWSSTSVFATNRNVSVRFALPAGLPQTNYSLVAVANGIASDPVALNLPLSLQLSVQSGSLVLSWPTIPSNIYLETVSNLTNSVWSPVTNTPSTNGSSLVLTNQPRSASAFFRLNVHN